jgi:type IV pilus assembly protein PilW
VRAAGRGGRLAGFSLLELLVGSFIGLLLVGLVLVQVVSAGRSQRLQAAQGQMIEDAQIAIELLRADFMMSGYGRPLRAQSASAGQASWQSTLDGPGLWACDHGFASSSDNARPSCAAASANTPASSAVEILYEADEYTTVVGSDGKPSDCLGNGLDAITAAGGSRVYITANRWQINSARAELRCGGRGITGPQPLVENVEHMLLWWGLPVDAIDGSALRYVSAAQVTDFEQVRAVRLCLLLRSGEPVLGPDDSRSYTDCQGSAASASDGRLRRAFWSTVALNPTRRWP